ncbi:RNA ligase 1-like [Babylonia areolata]|uniref:RNA ligase 1-like n=1 Tax=Babylonia areolata TaxID=304850 RepID=UPI003FD32FA5
MASCIAVQQKMSCVYVTGVQNTPSTKRANQQFKVTASDVLNPEVDVHDLEAACATEKVDGTCCLVQEYQGLPWLWARLDRKPNKQGDKKFQRYQSKLKAWKESEQTDKPPSMTWDHEKDFKEVPATWIPASGIEVVDGDPQPDKLGHTPGWVPVETNSRQYCWHLSSVNLDLGIGLVLCRGDDGRELVIKCQPLSELCGKTCELIGTNINGNPYGVGNKRTPLHLLVVHGSLPVTCPSPAQSGALHRWLSKEEEEEEPETDSDSNKVEGVVWHCPSGALFKLHRHHLNLPWPVKEPRLSGQPVRVHVDSAHFGFDMDSKKSHFSFLASVNGSRADKLCELHHLLNEEK